MKSDKKPVYKLIRQYDGKILHSLSVENIADYLDSTPQLVRLHIDHDVQIRGYQIKSIK